MSPLIGVIVAAMASAPGDLETALDLYRSGDLKGSLPLLLDSLDGGSLRQRATARLYIGLIQHRTGNPRDASGSFKHALELWPQIRPPKGTPRATLEAFEVVRAKVAPDPPPTKTRDRKRQVKETPDGPEVLEPMEGQSLGSSRDWAVAQEDQEEDPLSITEPSPETEDDGVPVLGWVAGSVGAAAAIAGVTLVILAGVNGRRALEEPESKPRARELHNTAKTQNNAALGSFGAAGVMFGVAALSVTF